MKAVLDFLRGEPVLLLSAIEAAIGLVAAFGLRLTPEQVAAVLTASGAILAVIGRQAVTPVSKSEAP